MATQWFTGGSLPPPPGIEPEFDNPPSQLAGNIALHVVFLTVVTVAVAMRLFTRLRVLRSTLGIDDIFCIASFCLTAAFSGLMITCYSRGIGRHMWDVPIVWLSTALKYFTIAQYIYLTLTATVKLTFLFFYYRIFHPQHKIKYLITFGIVFVAITHITILFLTIFSCAPVSHAWNAASPGRCWNPKILPYLSGALSSVTDLYVLILPIRSLWDLNMTTRRKLRLAAVFGLGSFACIASLIRLGMTHVLTDSTDATWNISLIARWAVIEANTGIICACLLLLPAFLDRYWPKHFGSSINRLWSSRQRGKSGAMTSSVSKPHRHESSPSRQNLKRMSDETSEMREVDVLDSREECPIPQGSGGHRFV
ncbi:hypothetical protein P175DRAFT_0536098 [Aspergillus ochraceoroseus IBT 24754]|uniref:Rhodopsin domain-containing protein n=3 Tax=Aspergillus subgen. Nidulantes TaxID=2720870 RepID=A0A0F8WNA6_9EURO|nr:uncharacterized protein P175DRAFT_0536098 [Aspergillus ochraceoroseus IBT 24754]KKK18675.1 hypothetical protein AOCH_004890 [Aspergillus ochraceoroseus]KKK19145.1 hypothetical protein ARAM_001415 [Aspergillus rambellii]PTU17281.1 hypothetical protein P175DRAFT_0536098 [Aspergillus ochraceoroseus IBT 24754]